MFCRTSKSRSSHKHVPVQINSRKHIFLWSHLMCTFCQGRKTTYLRIVRYTWVSSACLLNRVSGKRGKAVSTSFPWCHVHVENHGWKGWISKKACQNLRDLLCIRCYNSALTMIHMVTHNGHLKASINQYQKLMGWSSKSCWLRCISIAIVSHRITNAWTNNFPAFQQMWTIPSIW